MWASSQATWWVLELVSRTEQGACLPQCSQQLCGWMQCMRLPFSAYMGAQCVPALRASLVRCGGWVWRLALHDCCIPLQLDGSPCNCSVCLPALPLHCAPRMHIVNVCLLCFCPCLPVGGRLCGGHHQAQRRQAVSSTCSLALGHCWSLLQSCEQ